MNHPLQPLVEGEDGKTRFKENAIVKLLLSSSNIDLSDIGRMGFSQEDQEQLSMLIGYSFDGFAGLSDVREDTYQAVLRMHQRGETETEARIAYLEEELHALRKELLAPIARLYDKHPDDLYVTED